GPTAVADFAACRSNCQQRKPPVCGSQAGGLISTSERRGLSVLRRLMIGRRWRRRRPAAALVHELVKLCLVLGVAQAVQEILEFGLLFLETLQRLLTVFVKG